MKSKKSYRDPVQYWSGYQTFVNRDSRDGITPPEDSSDQGNQETTWPVKAPRKREKERALPLPSSHPKNRQKTIGPAYYNKNDHYPARTKGEPGEERGHPTKYDYNMPTRRSLKAYNNPGSTPYIRKPSNRQKNQKGPSKQKSRQEYLKNRSKLRPVNRKKWLKKKRNPREQKRRDYYEQYPKRYERKGYSPYSTPAQRTKAWREKQKIKRRNRGEDSNEKEGAMWPQNWNTQTKVTDPPTRGNNRSLRAPNLWDKPQQGLLNERIHPSSDTKKPSRIQDQTNGAGKVFPRDSDLLNNKRVYKEEEINYRLASKVLEKFMIKKSAKSLITFKVPIHIPGMGESILSEQIKKKFVKEFSQIWKGKEDSREYREAVNKAYAQWEIWVEVNVYKDGSKTFKLVR